MIEAAICIILLVAFAWLPLIFTIRYTFKLIEKIPKDAWKKTKKTTKTTANTDEQSIYEKPITEVLKGFTEQQIRDYIIEKYGNNKK